MPNGPLSPTVTPGLSSCSASVTFPVLRMVISILSVIIGSELGVNGASPNPGTVSCMNWPARNSIGLTGLRTNVLIVGVSVIISSTTVSMG